MKKSKNGNQYLFKISFIVLVHRIIAESSIIKIEQQLISQPQTSNIKGCAFQGAINKVFGFSSSRISLLSVSPTQATLTYQSTTASTQLTMAHISGTDWFVLATSNDKLDFYNVNQSTIEKSFSIGFLRSMKSCDDLGDNAHIVSIDESLLNININLWDRTLPNNNSSVLDSFSILLTSVDRIKRLQDGQHVAVEYGISTIKVYNAVTSFTQIQSIGIGSTIVDFSRFGASKTLVVLTSASLKFVDWSPLSTIQTIASSSTSFALYTPNNNDLIFLLKNSSTLSLYSRSLQIDQISYTLPVGNNPYSSVCASHTGEYIVTGSQNGHQLALKKIECSPNCKSCSGVEADSCITCLAGLFLRTDSTCSDSCYPNEVVSGPQSCN